MTVEPPATAHRWWSHRYRNENFLLPHNDGGGMGGGLRDQLPRIRRAQGPRWSIGGAVIPTMVVPARHCRGYYNVPFCRPIHGGDPP